jgi:tetratricopeptide (TPR) repeat protein
MRRCSVRTAVARWFAVACGGVVLATAAAGADFKKEFEQATALQREDNYKGALALYMGLLTTRFNEMSDEDAVGCYRIAVAICGKLGDWESWGTCFGILRQRATAIPEGYIFDFYHLGIENYMKLGKAEDALAALAEAEKAGVTPEQKPYHAFHAAWALGAVGRKDEARAVLLGLLEDPNVGLAMDDANAAACVKAAVEEATAKEDWAAGTRRCLKTLSYYQDYRGLADPNETPILVTLRRNLLPKITDAKTLCELAEYAATLIPPSVRSPRKCFEFQKAIVILYSTAKSTAEADAAISTLWETCPAANFDAIVGYVSNLLKTSDGSLARANRFLEYVKTGTVGPDGKPGTEDDTVYPFADCAVKRPAPVEEAYATAESALLEDKTWQGQHARSYLYRYWGKQKQALQALSEAFSLAPMDPQPLQLIAGDMVNVLIQVSGDPAKGDILSAFLKYGKEGKDGRAGTEDDIADPLAPFLKG